MIVLVMTNGISFIPLISDHIAIIWSFPRTFLNITFYVALFIQGDTRPRETMLLIFINC